MIDVARILAYCVPDFGHSLTSSREPLLVPYSYGSGNEHDPSGDGEPAADKCRVQNCRHLPTAAEPGKPNVLYGADVSYVADYTTHVSRLFGLGRKPDDAQLGFMETSRRPPPHGLTPATFVQHDTDVTRAMRGTLQLDSTATYMASQNYLAGGEK